MNNNFFSLFLPLHWTEDNNCGYLVKVDSGWYEKKLFRWKDYEGMKKGKGKKKEGKEIKKKKMRSTVVRQKRKVK